MAGVERIVCKAVIENALVFRREILWRPNPPARDVNGRLRN
jgi:hypothetical protein